MLKQQYARVWESLSGLPRLATSWVCLTTYYRWVFQGEWLDKPAYLFPRLGYRQTYTCVRFKLGCHDLAIETGRWDGTPHMSRDTNFANLVNRGRLMMSVTLSLSALCLRTCVLLAGIYSINFDMQRFFAQDDQRAVVMYILDCLRLIGQYDSN